MKKVKKTIEDVKQQIKDESKNVANDEINDEEDYSFYKQMLSYGKR